MARKIALHLRVAGGGTLCRSDRMNPPATDLLELVTCADCRRLSGKRLHPEVRARLAKRGGITSAQAATFVKFERR